VTSPWELALRGRLRQLDPALADYFSTIPEGSVGRGSGTFDVVGTPRRWVWPVFAILARAAIAFPVWEREVPFGVVNVPGADAVRATLAFGFRRGERVMRHEIRMTAGGLVDALGTRGRLRPLWPRTSSRAASSCGRPGCDCGWVACASRSRWRPASIWSSDATATVSVSSSR